MDPQAAFADAVARARQVYLITFCCIILFSKDYRKIFFAKRLYAQFHVFENYWRNARGHHLVEAENIYPFPAFDLKRLQYLEF